MPRYPSLLLILSVVLLCSVQSAPAQSNLAAELPNAGALERLGLEMSWWSQTPLIPSRDTVRHVTVDEDTVYVQATSGAVTAFEAETGTRLWTDQLGRLDHVSFPATSNEELVLVVSGLKMFAVNKFNGDLIWENTLPSQPSTGPSLDDDRVYVGLLDGSVVAYDLALTRELTEKNLFSQYAFRTLLWRYATGKRISTAPITTGSTVAFASVNNSVYAVSGVDGHISFEFQTDAPVTAALANNAEQLFLASEDFQLYCVNLSNGVMEWEPFPSGRPIIVPPMVVGAQIYISPQFGGMFALSVKDGKRLWWKPGVTDFLAASTDRVYVSDDAGNLVVVDRNAGTRIGIVPLKRFTTRVRNNRTDRVFMATQSGRVICLREQAARFPTFHKYPERKPLLPEFAPEE